MKRNEGKHHFGDQVHLKRVLCLLVSLSTAVIHSHQCAIHFVVLVQLVHGDPLIVPGRPSVVMYFVFVVVYRQNLRVKLKTKSHLCQVEHSTILYNHLLVHAICHRLTHGKGNDEVG